MIVPGMSNTEVNHEIENRRWVEETLQALRLLVGIGLPLLLFFVILVIVFNVLFLQHPSSWILEAPMLLMVLNTLFVSIAPFVVALIALQGYIEGGSANLLFFGCGMFSFSLACFVAGWLGAQAQANANFTIHNTGVLLASLFNFLAGVTLYLRKSPRNVIEKYKKNVGIFAYVGILIFIAVLSFAALRGYLPPFYIDGSGPTLLREVVITAATIFFGVSCFLIAVFDRDRRSFFLSCYAIALALITVGLIALMTSQRANSPLSWLGRSAQFGAGIYFLAAVVAAVRAAWANRWTVPDTVRDFLRPSEALYRDLVETATDAIIPISTSGEIFLWNTAAEQMFGYKRMEALRLVPSDLMDPEDSKKMFQEIEAGMVSGKRSYVGKMREVRARKKSGDEFPAELSFSSRRSGGGWISTLIIRDITERKRAEEQLRQAEEKSRLLIKHAPSMFYEIDFHGPKFKSVNDTMCEFLGYTRTELLAMNPFDLLDDEGKALFRERIRRQLAGETIPDSVEYKSKTKDGREVFGVLNVTFTYKDGKPEGAVVVAHDITGRKRAEESLRDSEQRLRLALDSAKMGTWDWDLETGEIIWNEHHYTLLGYQPGEVKPSYEAWANRVHPQDFGSVDQALRQKEGGEYTKEYRITWPDKTEHWVQALGRFQCNEAGRSIRSYGVIVEITERKRIEEALLASRNQLQSVIDNTADLVYVFDLEERFLVANRAVAELLNSSPERMIGKRRNQFMAEETAARHEANDRKVIEAGISLGFEEYGEFKGKAVTFITNKFPLRDRHGRIYAVGGITVDITDRKRVEKEVRLSRDELEVRVQQRTAELADLSLQLVTAQENERKRVSYDLHDNVWQTLLAIRFNIESLFSGQEDWKALRKKSKEVTEEILAAIGKIRSMQGDLWPYVLDDIGIRATIEWYCRDFEKNHSGLNIENHVDLREHEVPSSAKIVIYRVMQEAMSNVAKHSHANHVGLSLVKKDDRVELTIADNGTGFDPEETISKRVLLGGLGLLNIKARTELSGGSFGIESAKSKGTTIHASWPSD